MKKASRNSPSIIDGVRLCKAVRYRYNNADMADLEVQLQAAQAQRYRLIVTDGVFSMDGDLAPLRDVVELKDRYGAWLMVDEAHATGLFGEHRRGLARVGEDEEEEPPGDDRRPRRRSGESPTVR